MKSKIFLSMLVIIVAVSMVVGGTMAYFADNGSATLNTFTSGHLDMQMTNRGVDSSYADDVSATWVSPINWAPGQAVSANIDFTNVGNIDIPQINFKFINKVDSILADKIIVTSLTERFGGITTGNQVESLIPFCGDGIGLLTLRDMMAQPFYTRNLSQNDGKVLAAGDRKDYTLSMTFKFAEDADSRYQELTSSFDMLFSGIQILDDSGTLYDTIPSAPAARSAMMQLPAVAPAVALHK